MTWYDELGQETIGQLHSRYSDLEEAAVAYVRQPKNARQFDRYAGEVVETPEIDSIGRRREEWEPLEYVWFPESTAPSARAWLAAGLLAVDEPSASAADEAPAGRGDKSKKGDTSKKGTLVRTDLAEAGLQLHNEKGLGRRKLPELGEWEAGQLIWWHDKVGEPAGLWLENDRLLWGRAITPVWDEEQDRYEADGVTPTTPRWLSLPTP